MCAIQLHSLACERPISGYLVFAFARKTSMFFPVLF
jgi:hypothetical protein